MKFDRKMTSLAFIAVATAISVGCRNASTEAAAPSFQPSAGSEANYQPGDYHVDHVVDGDTVWLRKGNSTVKVRLLRVDAPELNELGFQEATEELRRQIGDESSVHLEFEEERLDPHGRTLAYLFVDGKNVNVAMVASGWSPFFDRYGRGKYASEFRAAEKAAKSDDLGIWANR
jgi:micrococcal nuclease